MNEIHFPLIDLAVAYDHLAAVQGLLLGNRAGINMVDRSTAHPLLNSIAMRGNLEHLACILQEPYLDASVLGEHDYTALHCAALSGHSVAVRVCVIAIPHLVNARSDVEMGFKTALHLSLEKGDVESAEIILNVIKANNLDPNVMDADGNTALHLASEKGLERIVHIILSMPNAQLSLLNKNGQMAFDLAYKATHRVILRLFLRDTRFVLTASNAYRRNGSVTLQHAAETGQTEVIEEALREGKQISTVKTYGHTLLHLAAFVGDSNLATLLVQSPSISVNYTCNERLGAYTAAHLALERGHVEVARIIVDSPHYISSTLDGQGRSVLQCAIELNYHDFARYLILLPSTNLQIVDHRGWNLFHTVAYYSRTELFLYLMKLISNIFVDRTRERETVYHCAAYQGSLDMMSNLLQHRAKLDIDSQDIGGRTPFYLSMSLKHLSLAEYLARQNVNVNICTYDRLGGNSALHCAVQQQWYEGVRFLVKMADLTLINVKGRTPLHEAAYTGNVPILEEVLTHTEAAAINSRDASGNTVLHGAVESGELEAVLCVLRKQPNVNAKNNLGLTPSQLAMRKLHVRIAGVLSQDPRPELSSVDTADQMLF
ncbi:MAG: ankyrin repeat domain-containing protein [Verrucomicrobia bacterium]|nr:ankyrin repeat domain-containing protein [Verrucomicrobiota bacterium]MBS0645019.1 ankyrin repeat domain-containing protein [Verrucomicrobiota bacterium]